MKATVLHAIEQREPETIAAGLHSDDAGARAFAAYGVAKLALTQHTDALARLLTDDNWIVRSSAAGAAGRLGVDHPAIVEGLRAALNDPEPVVVRLAIQALGKLGSNTAIEALIDTLRSGPMQLANETIIALGRIGDARATDALIAALPGLFQSNAIQALGQIGDARAIDPLLATFAAGVDGFTEWYIVAALRDIGERERILALVDTHPDAETRRLLTRVADEWWPDEAAVHALIKAMSDEAAAVRSSAAFKLNDYNLPERLHEPVKAALRSGLDDEDDDVRHWCTQRLEEWGT